MAIRRGTIEKEVIPDQARLSIFRTLYFVEPLKRLAARYVTLVLGYPTHCTSPLRNNPSSPNWSRRSSTWRSISRKSAIPFSISMPLSPASVR